MVVCLRGKRMPMRGQPPAVLVPAVLALALALALVLVLVLVLATLAPAALAPAAMAPAALVLVAMTPATLAPAAMTPATLVVLAVESGGRWLVSKPGWGRLIWPGVLMRSWLS